MRSPSTRRCGCSSRGPTAVQPGVRRHQRECAGRRRHLRAAGRPAAGDRAGRGAGQAAHPDAAPRPARAPARAADRRRARPARAPADAARRDRLELRPARRRRAAACVDRLSVFARRLRPRRGRGASAARRPRSACDVLDAARGAGRPEPGPPRRDDRRRAALRDARDDPRVRRRDARRRAARARPIADRHARRHARLAPSGRARADGRGPARAGSTGSSANTTTCGPPSIGRWPSRIRAGARRLAIALWRFWQQRGYLNEARGAIRARPPHGWALEPSRSGAVRRGIRRRRATGSRTARPRGATTTRRCRSGATLGDKREIANALFNRAYADMIDIMEGKVPPPGPGAEVSTPLLDEALGHLPGTRRRGRRGEHPVGPRELHYFSASAADAESWYRRSLELHRAAGNRTMEAWSLHMLGLSVVGQRRSRMRARSSAMRCATSTKPGTFRASPSCSTIWRSSRSASAT